MHVEAFFFYLLVLSIMVLEDNLLLFLQHLPSAGGRLNETTLHVTYAVTSLRKNPTYINYYVNWFRLLGTGVIPMGVLIFLNVNIYRKLIETRKKRVRSKTLAAAGASTNTAVTNLTVNTVAGSEA